MEPLEIIAYVLVALLAAVSILKLANCEGEKPEDIDFK
jgi:hypothetical protein